MKSLILIASLSLIACTGNAVETDKTRDPTTTTTTTTTADAGTNGSNGEGGASGNDGMNGSNGKDGIDNHITKTWKCDFTVSRFAPEGSINTGPNGCTDTGVSVAGYYYAAETTAGDVFVRVGVDYTSNAGGYSTAFAGATSSYFWKAGTWEASNGVNWLANDICGGSNYSHPADPSSYGSWEFTLNKQTNHIVATYKDSDVLNGKVVVDAICK